MKPIDSADIYQYDLDPLNQNESHTQIINKIPSGKKILDVGCACGDLGKYLHQHHNCQIWGIEFDPDRVKIAIATGAYEEILQTDLNAFPPDTVFTGNSVGFDYIVFGDVLEHLIVPQEVVKRFLAFLAPGGYIIASLPNIAHGSIKAQLMANRFEYMDCGILDRTHLRFFTASSVVEMATDLELEIHDVTRTIFDLPGLHSLNIRKLVPLKIFRSIAADNISYIYQFVIKLKPSAVDARRLRTINAQKINAISVSEMALINSFRHYYLINYWKRQLRPYIPEYLWLGLKKAFNRIQRNIDRIRNIKP